MKNKNGISIWNTTDFQSVCIDFLTLLLTLHQNVLTGVYEIYISQSTFHWLSFALFRMKIVFEQVEKINFKETFTCRT